MAKTRETSTEKDMIDIGSEFSGGGIEKKPNWVNLAQLDGPMDDSLANRLLYKPALRFHGITGGIWGQGLSDAPSVTSDPPPSYRFAESMTSRQPGGDACSTCDVDTLYNTVNISAQSPLTLRRRNTVAVILVAIALLAAVAAVTGVILHFLHPKAMLRANVRFSIANRNFTEDMTNTSSIDFHDIARPLCQEMDVYFLTSELADFYLGCNVVTMRKDTSRAKNGTEVHYTLDFTENKVSNDAERIKKIIMRKSGRHKTDDTLYLTIRDFLVYLRSLRVGVEVLPVPDDHPGRRHRPRIPWNEDIDFIARLPKSPDFSDIEDMKEILRQLVNNMYNMTAKIDQMQDAINFINQTFHETHKPLFNLEGTIGNMSASLGNLNQNLNSINATMNAFKAFLKQFGNTVFNIDDIIRHIDETIDNLGNAVKYIENSMTDLNGTVTGIAENVVDIDKTLTHVNRSVLDVNNTAAYSNQTLDSMKDTLSSLENAVSNLALKVHIITDDADVLDISLKNINDTVKNTHSKLNRLHGKMQNLNSSMIRVETQVHRLKDTYTKINNTLQNMNEPYMFINGTALEVIQKLSNMDEQLANLYQIMDIVKTNITHMNASLLESMDWMEEMVQTLTNFNLWVGSSNNTIKISLRNKGMIETVGMLLNMNGTLSDIGHKVDDTNMRLDKVDQKLQYLEEQLSTLDRTLDNIDVKFKLLDKTLTTINVTVDDTKLSLNAINSTVQAMDSTFSKLYVSFDNINDTLEKVNKTLTMISSTGNEINATVNNVNKTFIDLAETIDETAESAEKLTDTVSKFTGSVPELNSQLYNANESLRITKSKADIASESYRLLNNTLKGVDETLSELRTKLGETNLALQHTNASLTYVNDSILGIQNSFQNLHLELSDVQNSFLQMKNSMQGFGSAFPNIQNSIQDAQTRMLALQFNISEIDAELHDHKITRDVLVKKQSHLQDNLNLISDMIDVIQLSVDKLKNRWKHLDDDVGFLNDSVNKATDMYNNTERNVKYINRTHDKLKNMYDRLKKHSSVTSLNLVTVKEDMELLWNNCTAFQKLLANYTNIDVTIDLLLSSFDNEASKYTAANSTFQHWTEHFLSVDEILWDEAGNPSSVFDTFHTLLNKTVLVNKTLEDFELVLNGTDAVIEEIIKFNDEMRSKLLDISNLRNTIDDIEEKEKHLNKEIADTNEWIENKHTNLTELLQVLSVKQGILQNIKDTYGDINGTFDSLTALGVIEIKLNSTVRELQEEIDSLNNSSSGFSKTVDAYKSANKTYKNTDFDLSTESQQILNNTLHVIEETMIHVTGINKDLDAITNSQNNIDFSIKDIDNEIDKLVRTLMYQKKKNNFVTAHHLKLESKFNMSFDKFNETQNMQIVLLDFLKELKNKSKVIADGIDEVPNINITTLEEDITIDQFITQLEDFDQKLSTANHYLETFFEKFVQFEESNNTLKNIKKEYEKYNHAVEHFGDAVKNISSVQTEMFARSRNISNTFDYLSRQINDFQSLEEPIRTANDSLQLLRSKLNITHSKVNQANGMLMSLRDEFDQIKLNYTNFTATEVDLTESYVIEAINEIEDNFLNISFELELATLSVSAIQDMFDDTYIIYKKKIFHRENIEPTIQSEIRPDLMVISERNEETTKKLDKINSIIQRINLSLRGVDETIHSTNKQLFIDRQKQLLADTKFPDLKLSTEIANESLSDSTDKIKGVRNNLKNTMDDFRDLKARLQNYPSVNISVDDFGNKLNNFNDTLETMFESLNKNFQLLHEINETIWIDDGERYSKNETVREMKARYKNAEDLLNDIFRNVTDINFIIEAVKNGTDEIKDELSSLDLSLHDFDRTSSLLGNLFQGIPSLDLGINDTLSKVKELEQNVSQVKNTFEKLKERFSHIEESIYNDHVLSFRNDAIHVNRNISSLRNTTELILDDFKEVHDLFDLVEQIRNKTHRSKDDLDNTIDLMETISNNVTQLLDKVRGHLLNSQTYISNLEPAVQELDVRLTEIEDIFSSQEKIEYFDSNFPRLEAKTELVWQSLINSSDFLDTSNGQFEKAMKATKGVKALLGKFPTINIPLTDIDEILQLGNRSLYNVSKRLNQNFDSLKKANQSLWLHTPEKYTDHEGITEMTKRYENAENVFDSLLADVSEVDNISSSVNEIAVSVQTDIGTINNSLKSFSETMNLFDHLIQELSLPEHFFSGLQEDISELERNVSKINETFSEIKNKFKNINSTVFSKYATTFQIDLQNAFEDVGLLDIEVNDSSEKLTRAKEFLVLANGIRQKPITSNLALDNTINNIADVNSNLVKLLNEVNLGVPDTERNMSHAKTVVQGLTDRLREVENIFLRQEKVDFFEQYFPGKTYESLNDIIMAVKEKNKLLDSNITGVTLSFDKIDSILDKHENINFDISSIGKSITTAAGVVANNSESIKDISSNYFALEYMLYADDGSVISDKESIVEMRKRYEMLGRNIDEMKAELESMTYGIEQRNTEVLKNSKQIKALTSLMDSYEKVREDVTEMERNNEKVNRTVEVATVLNSERAKTFGQVKESYWTLISDFNGITSVSIHQLKLKINANIKSLTDNISQLEDSGKHLIIRLSNFEELTENYTDSLYATYVDTEPLGKVLSEFPEVNDTVSRESNFVSRECKAVQENGLSLDSDLYELREDIAKLRRMLIEQEKQDYIKTNAPELLKFLKQTTNDINETKTEIYGLNESSNSLNDLHKAVKLLISNESSLDIPLITSRKLIESLDVAIPTFQDTWYDGYSALNNTVKAVLGDNGTYFGPNDTIQHIKNTFERLNHTLQTIGKSLNYVLHETGRFHKDVGNETIFLHTLKEETQNLQKLQSEHKTLKQQMTDSEKDIQTAKFKNEILSNKIQIMEGSLDDVVRKYGDVKEPSLHHDIGLLYDDIRSLKDEQKAIQIMLNATYGDFNNTVVEIEQLENIYTNVSRTLEELQAKTFNANPASKEISINLVILNADTKNITKSINEHLGAIPTKNKSIAELREKLRRQQIYEYIKENFPTLLEEYANVNITLNSIDKRLPEVSAQLQILKRNSSDLIESLSELGLDSIPFDDIMAAKKKQDETFSKVLSEKNGLEDIFNDFQDVISSNFDSNETLDDIKIRFAGYETSLHDMNKKLKSLHTTLDGIDLEINTALNSTRMYNIALSEYEQVLKDVEDNSRALKDLGILMNNTNSDLQLEEDSVEYQKSRIIEIGERFKNVNSSFLHDEKNAIERKLKDVVDAVIDTRGILTEELKKFDKSEKEIVNVRQLLSQNFTNIDHLQMVTEDAKRALGDFFPKQQTFKLETETKIKSNISIFNVTIAGIESEIDNLYDKFLKKEKADFISSYLPQLRLEYNALNKSLSDTNQRLHKTKGQSTHVNQTLSKLQQRIETLDNVQFSTENATHLYNLLQDNISDEGAQLNKTSGAFGDLDAAIFNRTDWSDYTIEDVKAVFDTFIHNMSLISDFVINANAGFDKIDGSLEECLAKLNNTNSVLDKYDGLVNTAVENESGLKQISVKLGDTHAVLEDVKKRFYFDGDRLFNLTTKYPEVTNNQIERIIDETRSILEGMVGLRIPLANKLFSSRIMENYNIVSARFDDVVYTLNENYTNKGDLEGILGDVEDTLNNVTLETEYMVSSEEFYREDAIRLSDLLNESSALLNKLEELYKIQKKNDLFHSNMPNLTKHWKSQKSRLLNLSENLYVTSNEIKNVNSSLDDIDNTLNLINTVNIPTDDAHANLTNARTILTSINETSSKAMIKLNSIPVFDIDVNALAENASVSVGAIQEKLASLKRSLQESDTYITSAEKGLGDVDDTVSSTKSKLILLNGTLSKYKDIERGLVGLGEIVNQTSSEFKDIFLKLKTVDSKIISYKQSLKDLNQTYKKFDYDSKDIEILIHETGEKLVTLNDTLSDTEAVLSEAEAEIVDSNVRLYTETDNQNVLEGSLNALNTSIPVTTAKVSTVRNSLNSIGAGIPDLDIQLQDLKDMLQSMNETLINEDMKSSFAENALPLLEEKYKITNQTFEMTNKTLQKMADDLEKLNNYIEELKKRMNDFSTINISMSDIDANITHLENRLVIMQDHYNNVKGIVNTFQNDIRVNNIFGRNISLSDVEDQYKTFNETLDLINEVLTKIDNEAYEMEDHFEALNDTMYRIDHALDRFERKQMNTKIMEKDIEITGNDIAEINDSINDIQNTVKGFRQTFDDMRVLYADVIDTTTENNTLVNDLLTSVNQSLIDLNNLMEKLGESHAENTDEFLAMNNTLFNNINSYADLNNTLDDVKNKLLRLSKSINKLQREIADAKQEVTGKNSTVSQLSELLESLNGTLHSEQLKYDFIRDNLGGLEEKFSRLKSPVDAANETLLQVAQKLHNASEYVKGVSEKLKDFSNVHISLDKDNNGLLKMGIDVSRIDGELLNVVNNYNELQNNFTQLDDRTGDMDDIVGKYNVINETLENLQNNLTDMLTALNSINIDTNIISNRTEHLDSSLDKLDVLNRSALSLQNTVTQIEHKLENTSVAISESETITQDLKQTLLDMERLYSFVDDPVLLSNLQDLKIKVSETSETVKHVQSSNNDIINMTTDTVESLKETQTRLNSDIDKQKTLDEINNVSDNALKGIQNETDLIMTKQISTENEVNRLQDTIAMLTNEILRLNETLAEEKRKKEFITENFPEMKDRYNLLNTLLNDSNKNIDNTSVRVDNVADGLTNVKNRLDSIAAIAIPLNSENDEVIRIRKEVENVENDFSNASKMYDALKINTLSNMSTDFDNLLDTYANFDKTLQEIEKTTNKMNKALNDLNEPLSVILESVHDINSTVSEYIETGDKIADVLESGNVLSKNFGYTNKTVAKLSDEVQSLADSLQNILTKYSHIMDPDIINARDLIKNMLESSKDNLRNLEKSINAVGNKNKTTNVMMTKINETYSSTKQLLEELKQHIIDVNNTSTNVTANLSYMEVKRKDIDKSAASVTPDLKNVFEKIGQLTDTFVKEQEKLDLIADNRPVIEKRFRDLQKPLEETNKHISLTEVKLADLKYSIKTVDSRLDKFKTLNITTAPELQTWNNLSKTVENMSNIFLGLNDKYQKLQKLIKTVEDRNMTIEEMKKKFSEINVTLDNAEDELKLIKKKLVEVESEIGNTEKALHGLQKTMNDFKELQANASKTKQNIKAMQLKFTNLEDRAKNIESKSGDIKDQLETMKTTYAVLNNSDWNKMLPQLKNNLANHMKKLKDVDNSIITQEQQLNVTKDSFDTLNSEIKTRNLTRKDVDSTISTLQKRISSATQQLTELENPLNTDVQTVSSLKKGTDKIQTQVDKLNATLFSELLKHNYVKQNLPMLKEKHAKVNKTFTDNIPSMEGMKGQIENLMSIIRRIKEKMRQYGVPDTDNSLKKWDVAIEKLNATVAKVLKKNEEAENKLVELKAILWSNNTMYAKREPLSDVIARFEGYNRTLDEINAASHKININLADLGSVASGVVEQLMERDAVLTTTPATTTPSGPPEWLSFQSTVSGEIGKDPGFAECAVDDLNEWNMMKITRVNKDGKEEPIAAWKLGAGARKGVRDRRIRVKRTKSATGGKLTVGIQTLQCEDEGTYYCSIDSYNMWPLESSIAVVSPPEDTLKPDFPTEVFEDKVANFSCTGHVGYPDGRLTWKIKREKEVEFRPFDFYSSKSKVTDTSCVRTEVNTVEYQFDLQWNNTKVRCYIENTDFYAEGIIRLLPYDICNKVRYLGTISHPYTPHKYIVCGKELNIMQCPGNTCYDEKEENCVRCKAGHAGGGDPCLGQPLFSYVAHETDCKKYYICMGPTKTSKKCAKGYFAPNIPGNCVMSYAQSHCGRKAG